MRRMFCFLRSTPKSRFNEWALSDLFSSLNRIEFTIVKQQYKGDGICSLYHDISLNRDLIVHHRAFLRFSLFHLRQFVIFFLSIATELSHQLINLQVIQFLRFTFYFSFMISGVSLTLKKKILCLPTRFVLLNIYNIRGNN